VGNFLVIATSIVVSIGLGQALEEINTALYQNP